MFSLASDFETFGQGETCSDKLYCWYTCFGHVLSCIPEFNRFKICYVYICLDKVSFVSITLRSWLESSLNMACVVERIFCREDFLKI